MIFPPTLTSCISCNIPTPTLISPFILISPELYTPLLHAGSFEAERPISPPGRTENPFSCLLAFKLASVVFILAFIETVFNSLIPGLNTVIIPKLPLDSISIIFWLSAFINTLPLLELPEGIFSSFILT